jgi:hypothetical protein
MALSKRHIEIKAGSNVRNPLGQGRSDHGNVVELQHFSGMGCGGLNYGLMRASVQRQLRTRPERGH